jgi:hypothetical protein
MKGGPLQWNQGASGIADGTSNALLSGDIIVAPWSTQPPASRAAASAMQTRAVASARRRVAQARPFMFTTCTHETGTWSAWGKERRGAAGQTSLLTGLPGLDSLLLAHDYVHLSYSKHLPKNF